MSGSDDFLDGLLRSSRHRARKEGESAPQDRAPVVGSEEERGLNPFDVLTLPHDQRELVNWLARRKQATLPDIAQGLGRPINAIQQTLAPLESEGYVHDALVEGEIYYRVVFRGAVSRAARGLPQDIWARVDLDSVSFLRQHPLFRALPENNVAEVARKMDARRYHRDEVILWQGHTSEFVYFIKNGIIGISRLTPQSHERKLLAYLKQGDTLGEYSLLSEQNRTATATATALSEVEVLAMKKNDFMALLNQHASVAVELARLMVHRLVASNVRITGSAGEVKLCLVFGVQPGAGATTFGNALAGTLSRLTNRTTVYTEYPDSSELPRMFGFSPQPDPHRHPDNYDIFVTQDSAGTPASVRATLVMDQLVNNYGNVVIGLSSQIDDSLAYIIERADQIFVVTPPDEAARARLKALAGALKPLMHPEKTSLYIVVNRTRPDQNSLPVPPATDFDIPYLEDMPSLTTLRLESMPAPLAQVAATVADRLGRTNQISLYIPSTLEADKSTDTTLYVEQTLAFLGKLFGGATTSQARGIWNSADAGLVSETIHIVRSFITQADLDRHLPEILDYMERLKHELKQEAMALEINQKFMLI